MSLSAYNWARDLKTLKSSTLKALLKELAGFENGTGEAWTDIPTLVRFTDLNRKTVIEGLQELVRRGVLADTGKRAGRTKQITVYRLVGFDPDFARTQREEEAAGKSPETGTLSSNPSDAPYAGAQAADSAGESGSDSPSAGQEWKESQNRNSSETGTVPFSAGKSPVFSSKQSQKRDTNGSNGINHSDARAHARQGARAPEPEQKPEPDPEQLRRHLAADVLLQFVDEVPVRFPELSRKKFNELPADLRQTILIAAQPIIERFAAAPRGTALHATAIEMARERAAETLRQASERAA